MSQSMVQQFESWLKKQPDTRTFRPWHRKDCIGYHFLLEMGYPVHSVAVKSWDDSNGRRHMLPDKIAMLINDACDFIGNRNTGVAYNGDPNMTAAQVKKLYAQDTPDVPKSSLWSMLDRLFRRTR